jgi:hypothetical protein
MKKTSNKSLIYIAKILKLPKNYREFITELVFRRGCAAFIFKKGAIIKVFTYPLPKSWKDGIFI